MTATLERQYWPDSTEELSADPASEVFANACGPILPGQSEPSSNSQATLRLAETRRAPGLPGEG